MRDHNRFRRRFELSLDGKQVASIVVGALVVLGAVFVLGLSVGRQLAGRSAQAPRAENTLAALDRPPVAPPPREKELSLRAHEVLTKGPAEAPIAEPAPAKADPGPATGTALNALPSPEKTALPERAATPEKAAGSVRPAKTAPAEKGPPAGPEQTGMPAAEVAPSLAAKVAPKPPRDAVAAAVARVSGAGGAEGRFSVQIAATQSEVEAQRLQKRHAAEGARTVAAEVPGKGTWYRVRIGAYSSRAEAERRRAALAAKGVKGFVADGN